MCIRDRDSILVKLPEMKPWHPSSRQQADSSGQLNWIDADRKRQGWWLINGAMEQDHNYSATAIVEEGLYIDGLKEGWWKHYNPDGSIKDSVFCVHVAPEK